MKNLTDRINEIREELAAEGSTLNDPLTKLIIELLDEIVAKLNAE
jgi:hypothetical protein|tara:strand:- start:459 stop:593 length:135 start_codon:yes stop_codon:yes gene_type:complete